MSSNTEVNTSRRRIYGARDGNTEVLVVGVRIGSSNIASLQTQRRLSHAASATKNTNEHLASGLRISRAADDAAGLSIASALNVSSRVYSVAQRNVSDSISAVSIASDALGALNDITIRQRELASQAANGTLSSGQRAAINKEARELTNEYNRIVKATSFNGRKLLASPWESMNTQLGFGTSAMIGYQFADSLSTKLKPGAYFMLDGVEESYVWFTVNGQGSDPAPIDTDRGIMVDVSIGGLAEVTRITIGDEGHGGVAAPNGSFFSFNSGSNDYRVVFYTDGDITPDYDWAGNTLNIHYRPTVPGETFAKAIVDPAGGSGFFTLNGQTFSWVQGWSDHSSGVMDSDGNRESELIGAFSAFGYNAWSNGDGTVTVENLASWGSLSFDTSGGDAIVTNLNDYSDVQLGSCTWDAAGAIDTAFASKTDISLTTIVSDITITNIVKGDVPNAVDSGTGSTIATLVEGLGESDVTADLVRNAVAEALNASGTYSATFGNAPGELIVRNLVAGRAVRSFDVNTGIVLVDISDAGSGRDDYSVPGMSYGKSVLADLDGDTFADIVSSTFSNEVNVLLNEGDGTFGAVTKYDAAGGCNGAPAVMDLNGDGRPDIVQNNAYADTVSVYLNRGDGTFSAQREYTVGDLPSNTPTLADVNGDGRPDILAGNSTSNTISVLINRGDGIFTPKADYAVGNIHDAQPTVGDVNGDNRPDIVQSNNESNTVSVLLNRGDGTFSPKSDYVVGTNPDFAVLADFNADGRLDFVTANEGSGTVSVLLNQGNGTFGARTNYAVGSLPNKSAVADVNGDNRPDIVQSNTGSSTVSVLLNQGGGLFGAATNYAVGSGPGDAATVADMNNDGRPDIVQNTPGDDTVTVLLNLGGGVFGQRRDYAIGADSRETTAVSDLNGDGYRDIVEGTPGTISVLLNQGDGTFGTPSYATTRLVFGDARGMTEINQLNLTTQKKARVALDIVEERLKRLSAQQGVYGSVQSRFAAADSIIKSACENLKSAESRIVDADIAEEAALLIRGRIVQQAASSVLAQANTEPQLALKLLQAM